MIWIIARKDLLANLLTLRLTVAFTCTVVLSVLTVFISSLNFSLRMDAYESEHRAIEEALDQAHIYPLVEPDVVIPPRPLSIMCQGVEKTMGLRSNVRLFDKAGGNPWFFGIYDSGLMKTLTQIDFATVIAVVMSFLAVALGFDSINGERESGTLAQMLTGPLSRGSLLTGKLLGGCLSLWVPFAVAFAIALSIVVANSDVHLSADDLVRTCLFFLLACLFLGQILALSMMVSTFTRHSATALIISLFGWLIGGVVYMNALPSFVQNAIEEEPFGIFRGQHDREWQYHRERVAKWQENNHAPGPAYLRGHEQGQLQRYVHPRGIEWLQRRNAMAVESALKVAEKSYGYLMNNQRPLFREAEVIDDLSLLSPFANFQVLTYQLAGTSIRDRWFFGDRVKDYRETYIEYLRSRGAFGSRRWFTDDPIDQQPMIADPESVTQEMLSPDSPFMRERLDWVERKEKLAGRDLARRLDLSDMPRLSRSPTRTLAETLALMTPGLVVMLLTTGLGLIVAFNRFMRYDPR